MSRIKKTVQKGVLSKNRTVLPPKDVDVDGFTMPIGWNFGKMDQTKSFEWRCTFKRLSKFKDRLIALEGKSFQQIEKEDKSNHAWEDTSNFNKEFLNAIEGKGVELIDLWQLRLGGDVRLFGTREKNIFIVRWLDMNHTVYKVDKKHT